MRKLALMLSAPGTPRSEFGTGFWKLIDQLLIVPVRPLELLFWTSSTQVPWALKPAKADSGICGLNVPKNGAEPCSIGVAARSSKVVLVKLAACGVPPTSVASTTEASRSPFKS